MIDLKQYFKNYIHLLSSDQSEKKIKLIVKILKKLQKDNKKLLIFGNGASSTIASHASIDFTKQAKLTALTFHDPALLTAFSNDYGFKNAFKEIIKAYFQKGDVIIFISVSGESKNIIEAVKYAKKNGLLTIGFSGKTKKNKLRSFVDYSFWVNSRAYNIVENIHSIWITSIIDCMIGKSIYKV